MTLWYQLEGQAVARELKTDITNGLTEAEARHRLEEVGPNELVDRGTVSPWVILLSQFREVMVIILIIAAIVSAVLGEFLDAAVVMTIVILNAILGFTQEYQAEQAMAALKKMSVPTVRVRRDGQVKEIPSTQLVPGDIVLLEAGNIVPADGRLVEGANLKVQEAALTGESEPVSKRTEPLEKDDLQLGDRVNTLFMGTAVTYGRGLSLVTETGMKTELGKIAEMIQGVEEEQTPLQRRLASLGKTLAIVALAIVALVIVLGLLRGEDLEILIMTGISMAVAVVPESLAAVVTITLALGARSLLKRQALIRRLAAVETLGSVTVICSDKTGTLTENIMTVTVLDVAGNREHIDTLVDKRGVLLAADFPGADVPPKFAALSVLLRAAALANDASLRIDDGRMRAIGDPTEGALLLAAEKLGFSKQTLDAEWPRVAEVPFTSERKRMTTVHRTNVAVQDTDLPWRDEPYVLLSKGAVDSMLEITNRVLVDKEVVPLDDSWRERILAANADLAGQGQRVLGIAYRYWESEELPDDHDLLEQDAVFVGLIAMIDPPRPEAKHAVSIARRAGIRPVMITGDHPLTAQAVASELGLLKSGRVVTGVELEEMSDADLEREVEAIDVYARVSPAHKLRVVSALQSRGHIVAMTGDGVNDAPALKKADIGIAMGITGTDVTKEAAAMTLTDDNFASIVAAVEEGRSVFGNIKKYLMYLLSSNIGEIGLMGGAALLGLPLPLTAVQILYVNLATDGLPALALSVDPPEKDLMRRKPRDPRTGIFTRPVVTLMVLGGIWSALVNLGLFVWAINSGRSLEEAMTMTFVSLVLIQFFKAYNYRSDRHSVLNKPFANKWLNLAVVWELALLLLIVYLPFLHGPFGTFSLPLVDWLIVIGLSLTISPVLELAKWMERRGWFGTMD